MKKTVSMVTLFLVIAGGSILAQPLYQSRLVGPVPIVNHLDHSAQSYVFDVTAPNGATICGFDLQLLPGAWRVELYATTDGLSSVGREANPSAWTLVSVNPSVTGLIRGVSPGIVPQPAYATPVYFPGLMISVSPGVPRGLCIAVLPSANPVPGFLGLGVNVITAQNQPVGNADLQVSDGWRVNYPFVSASTVRRFAGSIYYVTPGNGTCSLPRPPYEFQFNQQAAALTIDNQPEVALSYPIRGSATVLEQHLLRLESSRVGAPYEMVITPFAGARGVSQGGMGTANGQSVNLDLGSPEIFFLVGGAVPALATSSFPALPINLPYVTTLPGAAAAQFVVIDPTHPDGFALSHAAEIATESCNLPEGFEDSNLPAWSTSLPAFPGQAWSTFANIFLPIGQMPPAPGAASGIRYALAIWNNQSAQLPHQMITCPIPLAGGPSTLSFALRRSYAAGAVLTVHQVDDNGIVSSPIATFAGSTPPGTEWSTQNVPFSASGESVRFLFRLTLTNPLTFMAIDDVDVQ